MSEAKEVKIGIFGGGGVGKTCITLRFVKNEYTEGYIPTIEDEFSKEIEVDNQNVSVIIIDTAGQEDFEEMRYSYYTKVNCFVFVFDIGNPKSIDDIKKIYRDAKDAIEGDTIHCVVAANKSDLRDEDRSDLVPKEEYASIESELNCKVIETSAKTGTNIQELFIPLIKQFLKPAKSSNTKTTEKKESQKSDEGGCCEIA